MKRILDRVGLQILNALQENARLSFSQLGRQVALSPPAVIERVRKMEDAGMISGYHAKVAPEKVGLPVMAFLMLTTRTEHYPHVISLADSAPEILECHHVSGDESFVMRAVVSSVSHLERLIGQLSPYGQTKTLIVLSSPVAKSVLELKEEYNAD